MLRLVLIVLAFAGCSDGSGPDAAPTCTLEEPICEIGARRCAGDTVEVCAPGGDACGDWLAVETCAAQACSEGSCRVVTCDPAREEVCNGRDDDCDGLVDEFLSRCDTVCTPACVPDDTRCNDDGNLVTCILRDGCLEWAEPRGCGADMLCIGQVCVEARDCFDMDGDGVGVGSECITQDCNDREPLERPGGIEICDGLDNDCNGIVDDNPGCFECDPEQCAPGTLECVGRNVIACVRGPDGCGVRDVLEQCEGEDVCQDGGCAPYACTDDRFEPNETAEDAVDVTRESFVGGQLCRDDPDWFHVATLARGDWIELEMRADGPEGDLDLALWSADRQLARSETAGSSERILWQAEVAGEVYAEVRGHDGSEGAYRLSWTTTGPRECDDDGLEPNDAHIVPALLTAESAFVATACPGDDDWYGPLEVEEGTTVMIQVTDGAFLGELEATLVDPDTLEVAHRPLRGGVGQNFGFVATARPLLLRVRGRDLLSFGEYGVRVVVAGPEACVLDTDEPNDSESQAGPLVDAAYLCAGDVDWYELGELAGGTRLRIEAQGTGVDPEIELYSGPQLVALATFEGRDEALEYRVPFGLRGPHFVRVSAWGPWFGPYRLDVDIEAPPACMEDPLEPDDGPTQATELAEDVRLDAALCAGSSDWFRLGFLERESDGDRLVVSVEHAGAEEDVTVRLFDGGVIATRGRSQPSGSLVDYALPPGERLYTVELEPGPEAAAGYTISWHLVGPEPCDEDELEPNDTREDATRLEAGETIAGQTCDESPDFFVLTGDAPEVGQRVRAVVRFAHDEGDIDIRMFHGDENVASGTSVNDDEEVSHLVPEGDPLPYSVEVFGFQGAEAPYDITFTIEDPE